MRLPAEWIVAAVCYHSKYAIHVDQLSLEQASAATAWGHCCLKS